MPSWEPNKSKTESRMSQTEYFFAILGKNHFRCFSTHFARHQFSGFHEALIGRYKKGVTERGVFACACQYIVSPSPRAGNHMVTKLLHSFPCLSMTKLRATIACQYSVGACSLCDIVLPSRSPHTCRCPRFVTPVETSATSTGTSQRETSENRKPL